MLDALFRAAVAAIDAGDVAALEGLLVAHPRLVRERLQSPGAWLREKVGAALDGFFQRPYLLWFVAEDPVRNGTLPANIARVARTIIEALEREGPDTRREQIDHALQLVAWSTVAPRCGVQIDLIDVLADAGASLDGAPDNALVNGNEAAARHLIARGATLTLPVAICLERSDDVRRLGQRAGAREKQTGLVLAALNGKAGGVAAMLALGADVNAPSADLYAHATPLHHAVCSGSLDAVKLLVNAGARLDTRDTCHGGTPLQWAEHEGRSEIAAYLRERGRGSTGA